MTHPSTLTLHRMRYGELSADEVRDIEAHLTGCEACSARLQSQLSNRAAFELAPVPDAIRVASKPARSPWRLAGWLVPALAAAMALVVISPFSGTELPGDETTLVETERTKGSNQGARSLQIWLDAGEPTRLAEGASVSPGDRVQLKYRARPGWVTFAGVDGRGVVEVYKAVNTDGSGEWRPAPFSLTLDDAPGEQQFLAVFTSERPDRQAVADALKSGKTVPGLKIERVTVVKPR